MNTKIESSLKWINIIAFILMVLVNGLAGGSTIIGGKNTAEISDAYPTLVTPAGYVFSIWGVTWSIRNLSSPTQPARQRLSSKDRLALRSQLCSQHNLVIPMAICLPWSISDSHVYIIGELNHDLSASRYK